MTTTDLLMSTDSSVMRGRYDEHYTCLSIIKGLYIRNGFADNAGGPGVSMSKLLLKKRNAEAGDGKNGSKPVRAGLLEPEALPIPQWRPSKDQALRMLRMKDVVKKTGMSRSLIYKYKSAKNFPKEVRLGARAVGYYEHEIDAWLLQLGRGE
jgi:prophage regulatory protein